MNMQGPLRYELGKRYALTLTVEKHSRYQATILHETEITKHRYSFVDQNGRKFVYTGVFVWALKEGATVTLRAGIKRLDDHGYIRLERLTQIAPYAAGLFDD